MKNFFKHWLNKNNFLLLAILFIAAGVRFYNFPSRVTFWSEQAQSLIVSYDYLKKPSLLGQEYFRADSNGHVIYTGAIFNYLLVPLILATKGDPILVTSFFALLNLVTGLVIYLVTKKISNNKVAVFSTILFLFSYLTIYHSLFIWIYNPLPLIGILILYFLYKRNPFWTGLLSGVGFGLQILFAPIAVLVSIVSIIRSSRRLLATMVFTLAAVLGNLPMVLFDLRHNFYQTRTLFQYFLDTLKGQSDATFNYYYFLSLAPLLAIGGGFILFWLWKKSKIITISILILYLFLNLNSRMVNWVAPTGMPSGITTKDLDESSKVIAADANKDFNVTEVLDFDKRAYVLRYFIQYKYGKTPLGITDYPNLKLLYVLSPKAYNFKESNVWEITAGGPYKVSVLSTVDGNYSIYKLTK